MYGLVSRSARAGMFAFISLANERVGIVELVNGYIRGGEG